MRCIRAAIILLIMTSCFSIGTTNYGPIHISIIRARNQLIYELNGRAMPLADMTPVFKKLVAYVGPQYPVYIFSRGEARIDDLIPLLALLKESGLEVGRLCRSASTGDVSVVQTEVPLDIGSLTNAMADPEFSLPLEWYFEAKKTSDHSLPLFFQDRNENSTQSVDLLIKIGTNRYEDKN